MRKLILFVMLMVPAICFATPNKSTVINKTLADANTEYQVELPTSTAGFSMQSRSAADFKWGNASTSGSTYFTVKSGTVYNSPTPLNLYPATPNTTIYLQSASAGQIIEIVAFQ